MTFLNDKKGFTSDEVRRSIEKLGPNSVPETSDHPLLRAFGNFWAPVPWMLEAAVVLELCLGNYSEAGILSRGACPSDFSRVEITACVKCFCFS
jgi:H+-transporting ATPase